MADGQGLNFRIEGSATIKRAAAPATTPPPTGPVLRGHVVCRAPDGTVRWEADTEPVRLRLCAEAGTADDPVMLQIRVPVEESPP